MDLRLALFELIARHGLDASAARRLQRVAGLHDEPASMARVLPRGIAVLGAALCGLGLILWIAANWETLGRFGRFALLQGFVLAMCLGALSRPAARAPLGLLALLGIGGLFAYFGQTYQTGADPWQLFALWAALALPLCLGVRSDVLWAPWALVAVTAISLWTHAHVGQRWWRVERDDFGAYTLAWGVALVLVAALSRPAQRFTGAGLWALRTAATLAVVMISFSALGALFGRDIAPQYAAAIAVLAVAAVGLASRAAFDVYALSAVALGLDTLLVCGLARWLFDAQNRDHIGSLLIIGAVAAALLAVSVSAILRLTALRASDGDTR